MEDWEQFFVEKSRRRAEKERLWRRRKRTRRWITGTLLVATIAAGLVILRIWR